MKSVRLGLALEERLQRAAAAAHLPESEVIRQGVSHRVDEILGSSLYEQLKPFIGTVEGSGRSVAREAHATAGELIIQEHDRQVRAWRRRNRSS